MNIRLLFIGIFMIFTNFEQTQAATQGILSLNSSDGSVEINLKILQFANLSGIDDTDFGEIGEIQEDLRDEDPLCVAFTNTGGQSVSYGITATGSGPGGTFILENESGNTIEYVLGWNDQEDCNKNSEEVMQPGQELSNQNASPSSVDCTNDNQNACISVEVSKEQVLTAENGTYIGTASINLKPN